MATTIEQLRSPIPYAQPLPERLRSAGTLIFAADCLAATLALAFSAVLDVAAPAFLALAATLLIAIGVGRYRVSFACNKRDEWYAAAGIGGLGLLCGIALAAILRFPWYGAPLAWVAWSAFAGLASSYLHQVRRNGTRYEGTTEHVREMPRPTAWLIEQAFVRGFDVLFATIASIVAIPIILTIALAILLDDGMPVFFEQERVGRDDREFTMYKFRTLRNGAGDAWVRPGDKRITRRGSFLRKSSLDELPQLWNVLRGDMSLVGPRPEMRQYADEFGRALQFYSQRHIVRPGLTGWAQLLLPRNLDPADAPEVLRYDLFYVQNVGIHLYVFCLVKTVCEFMTHAAV
jgi:lipopolysaccharide/colanic/teichoic acid biosynthesis glycosyltransferase